MLLNVSFEADRRAGDMTDLLVCSSSFICHWMFSSGLLCLEEGKCSMSLLSSSTIEVNQHYVRFSLPTILSSHKQPQDRQMDTHMHTHTYRLACTHVYTYREPLVPCDVEDYKLLFFTSLLFSCIWWFPDKSWAFGPIVSVLTPRIQKDRHGANQ